MSAKRATKCRYLAVLLLCIAPLDRAALASGDDAAENSRAGAGGTVIMPMEYQKSLNMDEPMPTGMAKPGMTKGDVKSSAERKKAEMEEMMREEMK